MSPAPARRPGRHGHLPRHRYVELSWIAGCEAAGIHNDSQTVAGFYNASLRSDAQSGCAHDIVTVHFDTVRSHPIRFMVSAAVHDINASGHVQIVICLFAGWPADRSSGP